MRLEVQLSMDGAAFADDHGFLEAARILRAEADALERGDVILEEPQRLRDRNGNRVGFSLVTRTDVPD